MSEDNRRRLKKFLKVLGTIVAVLLLIVVVGFGLIVGFCALSFRH
jgi:ABC-type phosphate/phosphonate transport system permease subunit